MIKETIPFNFNEIYSNISNKFVAKGYDIQEGSNTMQLVTAMSYLVSMLNANTAVNINETLLSLARKRNNVLQDARILGYEIVHTQSFQYKVRIRFFNGTDAQITKKIDKYTPFFSGNYTYWYLDNTINNIVVPPISNNVPGYKDVDIVVVEGELHKFVDEPDVLSILIEQIYDYRTKTWKNQNYVDIPFTNVEDTYGIELFLTYYDENGTFFEQEKWTRTKQFMIDSDTVTNKEYIRLDNISYGTPRVHFKLGDVGKEIRSGSIVQMNILRSNGSLGAITSDLVSMTDGIVLGYELLISGTEEENIENIKTNAVMYHNSANRVVTKSDYIAFANRNLSVNKTEVWDGNREFPRIPGNIWFSFTPTSAPREFVNFTLPSSSWKLQNIYDVSLNKFFIKDEEISKLYLDLEQYRIPTLKYLHRHPVYFDFEYDVKISRYNINVSKAVIHQNVFNVIDNYFSTDTDSSKMVESFNFEYFQSNLIKRIDSKLTDNIGVDLDLKTSIILLEKHINTETLNNQTFSSAKIHLGIPFEGLFNSDGTIITGNMPDIDTPNVVGAKKIYTDKTTSTFDASEGITSFDIKITGNSGVSASDDMIIGSYKIFNKNYQDIEITLFVITGDTSVKSYTSGYTTGIPPFVFSIKGLNGSIDESTSGLKLNVNYPSKNIPFTRNTIPRLKQVSFN